MRLVGMRHKTQMIGLVARQRGVERVLRENIELYVQIRRAQGDTRNFHELKAEYLRGLSDQIVRSYLSSAPLHRAE